MLSLPGPLIKARLVQRYKRFFLDVETPEGAALTAHCPNSGSLLGLKTPGMEVLLTDKGPDHNGKLRYVWQAVKDKRTWVGVNTVLANQVAAKLLEQGLVPGLEVYQNIRREVAYGRENSRIDFLLQEKGAPAFHLEVKSVTLKAGKEAQFPDAVTARGQKHLRELTALALEGQPSGLLFLVQRGDCMAFAPAEGIDPAYGSLLRQAVKAGVKVWVISVSWDEKGRCRLMGALPADLA